MTWLSNSEKKSTNVLYTPFFYDFSSYWKVQTDVSWRVLHQGKVLETTHLFGKIQALHKCTTIHFKEESSHLPLYY